MALTRANVEFMIVAEELKLLLYVGMAVTTAGSNTSLNTPIGLALIDMGYTVASIVLVTDTDVAQVTDTEITEFLDICKIHTLETILGCFDGVDLTAGPRSEKFSQFALMVERKLERLRASAAQLYGYGLTKPEIGVITTNIAEVDDGTSDL